MEIDWAEAAKGSRKTSTITVRLISSSTCYVPTIRQQRHVCDPPLLGGHQLPLVNESGHAITAAFDVVLKPAFVRWEQAYDFPHLLRSVGVAGIHSVDERLDNAGVVCLDDPHPIPNPEPMRRHVGSSAACLQQKRLSLRNLHRTNRFQGSQRWVDKSMTHVLLVEDEPLIQMFVVDALEDEGFDVITAEIADGLVHNVDGQDASVLGRLTKPALRRFPEQLQRIGIGCRNIGALLTVRILTEDLPNPKLQIVADSSGA
jgi:CheY-like chemotaxis protein